MAGAGGGVGRKTSNVKIKEEKLPFDIVKSFWELILQKNESGFRFM